MISPLRKEIGLTIISAVLSLILFGGISLVLLGSLGNTTLLVVVGILAVIWTVITALTLFSASHWWASTTVAVVATLATIAAGRSWGALGGGVLLGLLCAGARHALQRDQSTLRQFRTLSIFRPATRLLVIGLVLAVAGLAIQFIEGSIKKDGLKISARHTALVLRPLQPILEGQLRQQGIDPAIVADRVNETLQAVVQANSLTVALVAVILAFLTIRAVIPLIILILLISIAGAVWLSRHVGLLRVQKDNIEVESLTL